MKVGFYSSVVLSIIANLCIVSTAMTKLLNTPGDVGVYVCGIFAVAVISVAIGFGVAYIGKTQLI